MLIDGVDSKSIWMEPIGLSSAADGDLIAYWVPAQLCMDEVASSAQLIFAGCLLLLEVLAFKVRWTFKA